MTASTIPTEAFDEGLFRSNIRALAVAPRLGYEHVLDRLRGVLSMAIGISVGMRRSVIARLGIRF